MSIGIIKKNSRPKTIEINTMYKEFYYQAPVSELKERPEEIQNRHTIWNCMMNVSMQNTVSQMMKRKASV